jgi:hypothetical protein
LTRTHLSHLLVAIYSEWVYSLSERCIYRRTDDDALAAVLDHALSVMQAKKTKNAGGKNKGKVGDEEGEEEEGWVDPRLPQAALPKRGELLVEFRNVFMPEAYGCAAEPMSGALFARLWSDHQRPDDDATDQFRLHLVRVICCRYWFSITQAVQVLATFLHPKVRISPTQQSSTRHCHK